MNITLRSLFGILTLAGLFCVPLSFPNGLRLYLQFWPGLSVTLLVMSVFTWRSKSRSIVKSFIFGTFCMLIPSLIWPFGYLFYLAMTSWMFHSMGLTFAPLAILLSIASVFGGLIGITLTIGFSKPKQ